MKQEPLFDAYGYEPATGYVPVVSTPRPFGPVVSQAQAHALLRADYGRQIDAAREVALRLCRERGTITVADLREAMPELQKSDGSLVWIGVVFNDRRFAWTGEWRMVGNKARNVHPKPVRVWRLR